MAHQVGRSLSQQPKLMSGIAAVRRQLATLAAKSVSLMICDLSPFGIRVEGS